MVEQQECSGIGSISNPILIDSDDEGNTARHTPDVFGSTSKADEPIASGESAFEDDVSPSMSFDEEDGTFDFKMFVNRHSSPKDDLHVTSDEEALDKPDHSTQVRGAKKFAEVDLVLVEKLPYDINGLCGFKVKLDLDKPRMWAVKDGRPWATDNSTSWRGYKRGSVRYSTCKGSFECENPDCLFLKEFGYPNKTQFEDGKKTTKCRACGAVAKKLKCPAKRFLIFHGTEATVYHEGNHNCVAVMPRSNASEIEKEFKKNISLTPGELTNLRIAGAIRSGDDWDNVKGMTKQVLDRKWLSNIKQKAKKEIHPHGENLEAVSKFKLHCDKKDPFYVYKMNSREMDSDKPTYVFKTSQTKAKIALSMNEGSGHFMEGEYAFFDGKSKKVRGYETLTLSCYHPLLRKQLPLATMDCEGENKECIQLFWELFNEVLQKVSKNSAVRFNPSGFCMDMGGANRKGRVNVFGSSFTEKMKSCEFHYKNCRNRHRQQLQTTEERVRFTAITDSMLESYTQEAYFNCMEDMNGFIEEKSESRSFLKAWIEWWDRRRELIFPAFCNDINAPRSNLAEVVHSSWERRNQRNLSLHDAAAFDVKESFQLDVELEEFEKGGFKGGSGPGAAERHSSNIKRSVSRAEKVAEQIFEFSGTGKAKDVPKQSKVINVTDNHRADKVKKISERKGQDKCRKTKFRSTKSKQIKHRIKAAIDQKDKIKIKGYQDMKDGRVYRILGSTFMQKEPYEVIISMLPSCTCPDFIQNQDSGPCKHIIWLYMFVFGLEETSDLLQQTALTSEELTMLLSVYEVPERFVAAKRLHGRVDECKQLLSEDPRFGTMHPWVLCKKGKKRGFDPSCPTCKDPIKAENLCVSVKGLYVPYGQTFVQEKTFYFCARERCIESPPFYSNLKKPDHLDVDNITQEEVANTGLLKFT